MGKGRAFHKAGLDIENVRDPVLVLLYLKLYLNLWSVDILSILAEEVSLPDMQAGCVLGFGKYCASFK